MTHEIHIDSAKAPDCWAEFGKLKSAVDASASAEELTANTQHLGNTLAVAASGNMLSQLDTALDRLTHQIEAHPETPEAVLAAHYLSESFMASGLVIPFCAHLLHKVLHADKLAQLEDLAIQAIEAMSCYGIEAAPFALDVVGCLLHKNCPAKVKECALDFFLHTGMPEACDGAFSVVADKSDDPVIRRWNADRKMQDSSEGGGSSAQ